MVKKSFSEMPCTLARALDVIGEWWSMLIVRDFFCGNGVRRFEELRDGLGISRNILTERLRTLTEADVIEKIPLREGGKRCAYQLTEKGRQLMPVMIAMMQWSEKWHCDPEQRFIVVRDRANGEEIAPVALKSRDGRSLEMGDVYLSAIGPDGERPVTEWPIDWRQRAADQAS